MGAQGGYGGKRDDSHTLTHSSSNATTNKGQRGAQGAVGGWTGGVAICCRLLPLPVGCTRSPAMAEDPNRAALADLLRKPENKTCADCGARGEWGPGGPGAAGSFPENAL